MSNVIIHGINPDEQPVSLICTDEGVLKMALDPATASKLSIVDLNTLTNSLKINLDGSINCNVSGGGSGSGVVMGIDPITGLAQNITELSLNTNTIIDTQLNNRFSLLTSAKMFSMTPEGKFQALHCNLDGDLKVYNTNNITGFSLNETTLTTNSKIDTTNSKLDSLITGVNIKASNGSVITTDANNNLKTVDMYSAGIASNLENGVLIKGVNPSQQQVAFSTSIMSNNAIPSAEAGARNGIFSIAKMYANDDLQVLQALRVDADRKLLVNTDTIKGTDVNTGEATNILEIPLAHGSFTKTAVGSYGTLLTSSKLYGLDSGNGIYREILTDATGILKSNVSNLFTLDATTQESNTKLNTIDATLTTIDATIQESNNKLTTINTNIDTSNTTLTNINEKINNDTVLVDAIQVAVKNSVSVSGSVSVSNLPAIQEVSGTISVDNFPTSTIIQGIDDTGATQNVFVDANGFITSNIIQAVHENISVGLDNNYNIVSLTNPANYWIKNNPHSVSSDGWYITSYGVVSMLYYNNGNWGSTPPIEFNSQSNFTFADIDIWYMILKNYNITTTTTVNMPQIRVYSKPTGANDFITGICHSRWDYTIDAGQFLSNGISYMIYSGLLTRVKTNDVECPRVKYSFTGGGGAQNNTEIINHIELWYPTQLEKIDLSVVEGAVYVKNHGLINYYFTNDNFIDTNGSAQTVLYGANGQPVGTTLQGSSFYLNTYDYNFNKTFISENDSFRTTFTNTIIDTRTQDGAGLPLTSTLVGGTKRALDVNFTNESILINGTDTSGINRAVKLNTSGNILVASSNTNNETVAFGSDYKSTPTNNKLWVDSNGYQYTKTPTYQNNKISFVTNSSYYQALTTGSAFWFVPDNTNPFINNCPATGVNGWWFKSVSPHISYNASLLWYNNGSYSTHSFPLQKDMSFINLGAHYVLLKNYRTANTTLTFNINVYSKPTGSGDYSPGIYRSKWVYNQIFSSNDVFGADVMICAGYSDMNSVLNQLKTVNPDITKLIANYNNGLSQGPRLDTEVVSHIEFQISNSVDVAEQMMVIQEAGFNNTLYNILTKYTFDNDIKNVAEQQLEKLSFDSNSKLLTYSTIVDSTGGSFTQTTNTTVPNYNKTGLNIFSILPKKIQCNINGFVGAGGSGNTVCGFFNNNTTQNFLTYGLGKANPRTWYFFSQGTQTPGIVNWVAVDSLGNEITGQTNVASNGTYYPLVGGFNNTFISVNKISIVKNNYPQGNDNFFVCPTNNNLFALGGVNSAYSAGCVYTCPNNAVAHVQSFSLLCGAADGFYLMKTDANGFRATLYRFDSVTSVSGYSYSDYPGYIQLNAGESVFWARASNTGNSFTYGSIVQTYF